MSNQPNNQTQASKPKNTYDIGEKKLTAGYNFAAIDPFYIENPDKRWYYFAAVNSPDTNRPGSVEWCKRIGYELDPDHNWTGTGHTAMRIPIELFTARKIRELQSANALQASSMSPDSLGVPNGSLHVSTQHGRKDNGTSR